MVSTALEASWAIKNCHPEQQVAYKHMHTSPCHSSKGVSRAPCVGFPKEHSLPACMVRVGVAQAPVWVLMPYPGCQGPASARLPGGLRPPPASWASCLSHSVSNIITCAGQPSLPKTRREHFGAFQTHVSREQNNTSFLSSSVAKSALSQPLPELVSVVKFCSTA